jgi:hypothetical protein
MKVLIDIRNTQLKLYPYKTSKLGKLYFPKIDPDQEETKTWEYFGVNDGYFGGNIHKIVALKEKPFYIIVNKHDETLGILHRFEDLNKYDKKDLAVLCESQGIIVNTKDSKDYLIDKLTKLKT